MSWTLEAVRTLWRHFTRVSQSAAQRSFLDVDGSPFTRARMGFLLYLMGESGHQLPS